MASLTGKRDSFGRSLAHTSLSSKVELHTLVEEDEEEEDVPGKSLIPAQTKMFVPTTQVTNPTPPHKNRPASLTLRHLSLAGDLPTPAATPSPRNSGTGGMRPLTLSSSLFSTPSPSSAHRSSVSSAFSLTPSSPSSPSPLTSGSVVTGRKQSHLSYRRNSQQPGKPLEPSIETQQSGSIQLRTPQSSISSHLSHSSRLSQQSSMGGERSFSPTELFAQQAFSMQAHATLLDRIATLEEALENAQAQVAQKPAEEELIALVADLKASRDTLHTRASAAEAKVAELEHAVELLKKRLENARQEAWQAKDRSDILQLEVESLQGEVSALKREKSSWETDKKKWKNEHSAFEGRVEELLAERDHARVVLDGANASMQARRAGGMGNMSSSSTATTMFEADGDESFESCRFPAASTSGLPFKFKDQGEPQLGAVAEEEEDEMNRPMSHGADSLQASFAANFAGGAAYSDDDEDDDNNDESHGIGSYEDEPTGFDGFIQHTMEEGDEMMDDFDDDHSEHEDSGPTPTPSPIPAPAPTHHSRTPSHSRRTSLVVNWRFPAGPAATTALTRKQASAHVDPFLVSDDDEDVVDEHDDAPRVPFIGSKKPSKRSQTLVEVTPQLADSFAMNFAAEDEGFSWGEDSAQPQVKAEGKPIAKRYPPRSFDPICPPLHTMEKSRYELPSIVPLIPKDESAAAVLLTPVSPSSTLTSSSSPTSNATTTAAASPVLASAVAPAILPKPKARVLSQGRPKVVPPAFIVPPPAFASGTSLSSTSPICTMSPTPTTSSPKPPPSSFPASLLLAVSQSSDASSTSFSSSSASTCTSTSAGTATTGDESFSFSFVPNPGKTTPPTSLSFSSLGAAEGKNVVAFPTTSSSPFAIRSPVSAIGSTLASFMPWSPRRSTAPVSPKSPSSPTPFTSLPRVAEDLQQKQPSRAAPGTKAKLGTVSADVMRERLRARLVQEGKIKSSSLATVSLRTP